MTVKVLIDLLKKYPSDMRVVVSGYEGGWDDVDQRRISKQKVVLNYEKESYEGQHEDLDFLTKKEVLDKYNTAEVLTIARSSN